MEPFDNAWLLSSWPADSTSGLAAGEFGLQIIDFFDQPGCGKTVIQLIREFQGSKAFVSFGFWAFPGGRKARWQGIERILKRLVGQFDLVVLAPAPLPGSCGLSGQLEFSDGGSGGMGLRSAFVGVELKRSVVPILLANPALVREGATTVLPILGTGYRWDHPALRLPKFPFPYSRHRGEPSPQDRVAEAILNLVNERLAAEALGATYVNVSSFNMHYADDLAMSGHGKQVAKGIFELRLPALEDCTFADLLSLRQDASRERAAFGSELLNLRRGDVEPSGNQLSLLQKGLRLQDKADALVSRYSSLVANPHYS